MHSICVKVWCCSFPASIYRSGNQRYKWEWLLSFMPQKSANNIFLPIIMNLGSSDLGILVHKERMPLPGSHQ